MKRFIAVLLVMGVIMTAFATTGTVGRVNITSTATDAAKTDVVLQLNQNAGIVWFSAGSNTNVGTYLLSLPAITGLNQTPSGNSNWYATGNDLVLNWNIVSHDSVVIELKISGKLTGSAEDEPGTIGWKLSFVPQAYSGNVATPGSGVVISAGHPDVATNLLSATAITKDNVIYGSSGSLAIDQIITENTYGKKVDVYTATLTATVKTN